MPCSNVIFVSKALALSNFLLMFMFYWINKKSLKKKEIIGM